MPPARDEPLDADVGVVIGIVIGCVVDALGLVPDPDEQEHKPT
jgi:hypothetical protein